ncbi:MAG: hypothetical protein ACP5VQ_08830, partial [Phycisphaerae bacterium]
MAGVVKQSRLATCGLALSASVFICHSAGAVNIQGILPMAADQPQIHALLENPSTNGVVYVPGSNPAAYDIQGYLDTGTSGIVLSHSTWTSLAVAQSYGSNGSTPVTFND